MFRIMHQMKFVVKPPTRTTTSTGRPCHKTGVPCRSVICLMGSPAASPYAKQALMIPQKVATSRPRFRLNSLMAARFCSSDNSRSFEIPAAPANAIPVKQIATPDRITIPEWVPSTCLANSPRKIGGSSVPKAAVYPSATAMPSDRPRSQQDFDQRFGSASVPLSADQQRERQAHQAELLSNIQDVLGPDRFAEYKQDTDPNYMTTNRLVERLNLPSSATQQ